MAQERPLTPEKQLLNLIESSKEKDASIETRALKYKRLSLFSLGAWRGRFSYVKTNLKKGFSGEFHQFDVRALDKVLLMVIVILVAYLGVSNYLSIVGLKRATDLKYIQRGEGAASLEAIQDGSPLKKSVAYYLDKVRQRDVFRMGPKKDLMEKEKGVEVYTKKIIEATKHLKLVGISWSQEPDAMIEDTRVPKTFFVKRGASIGEVKIQAIFKDKVILSYDQEEIELR